MPPGDNKPGFRPRERDVIIESLRAGVTPRTGLQKIQVARAGSGGVLIGFRDKRQASLVHGSVRSRVYQRNVHWACRFARSMPGARTFGKARDRRARRNPQYTT